MMRRAAYVLCAVIWLVPFAAHASPLVTYTWETLSSQPNPFMIPLSLSFTVDGNVAVNADSSFAPPSSPPTPFPFPPALLAFNLNVGDLSIALNSFTSAQFVYPEWTFELAANPAALTADLSLFFVDSHDLNEITGGAGGGGSGQASTGAVGTIGYVSDDEATGCRAEQRLDQLFAELADARAAERISAESAAGLRHQLDLLRARRPWWRRWVR